MNRASAMRIVSGIGVVAVMAAAAAAAHGLEPPVTTAREPVHLEVPPATATLVCPGPVRLLTESDASDDVTYDPAFAPAPSGSTSVARAVTVVPSALSGAAGVAGWRDLTAGPDTAVPLEPRGAGSAVVVEPSLTAPFVLTGAPVGELPADIAAAVATTTPSGDLRGVAAASCSRPAADLWLVGGSTLLGSSARLVMQNPGATAATVTLEMWGTNGALEPAGPSEFLVPPGAERAVLLEGIAAEQHRIVVHLTASGGTVGAYLQDSALNGFVAAGIDLVVAGAAPAEHQRVTGVTISGPRAPDTANLLRLLAPAAGGAHVAITVLGPKGVVDLPGSTQLDLPQGLVTDVALDALPDGVYTLVVDASAPVVAGAMVVRAGASAAEPTERAWAPSTSADLGGIVALPPGIDVSLVLGAPSTSADAVGTSATGLLRVVGRDGGTLTTLAVGVPVGSTSVLRTADLSLPADAAAVELVVDDGSALVMAAVLAVPLPDGGTGISVLAPIGALGARGPVAVRDDPRTGLRAVLGD